MHAHFAPAVAAGADAVLAGKYLPFWTRHSGSSEVCACGRWPSGADSSALHAELSMNQ